MNSYTDLFYFMKQRELVQLTLGNVATIQSKLIFYDNELTLSNLDDAFNNLLTTYNELTEIVNQEKAKFTKEELQELSLLYKSYDK